MQEGLFLCLLRRFDECLHSRFQTLYADLRVQTRTMRTFIDDTKDGNGMAVLNAGGQIPFAGYGHNDFGTDLNNDATSDGSPRSHGNTDSKAVAQLKNVPHGAGPTAYTVVNMIAESMRTTAGLNAVREKDKQFFWWTMNPAVENQFIIYFDK